MKCPHCGTRLRVALFVVNKQRHPPGQFQSVVETPPGGTVRSFLWFMRGKRWRPTKPKLVVRSEVKTSPHQILINELELPISEAQAGELAHLYLVLGYSWSRENTVSNTSISQYTHNRLTECMVGLRFLDQPHSRRYDITDAGFRFLRHYLPPHKGER